MTDELEFDRSAALAALSEARQRIKDGRAALAAEPTPEEAHRHAYVLLEDALEAAALVRGLGGSNAELKEFLATASEAALELFRRRGALTSEVIHHPSGEVESFVDTSLTNPWTFIRSLYSALAAGHDDVVKELSSLAPESYSSDQVEVKPIVERYLEALRQAAAGDDGAVSEVNAIIQEWGKSRKSADRFWAAQAKVLAAALRRDESEFRTSKGKLVDILDSTYGSAKDRDDVELLLKLPVLGLTALARRFGMSTD